MAEGVRVRLRLWLGVSRPVTEGLRVEVRERLRTRVTLSVRLLVLEEVLEYVTLAVRLSVA